MPRPAKPEPEIDADTDEPGTKPKSKAKPPLKPRAKAAAKPKGISRSAASAEPAPGPRLDLGHVAALGVHVFTACGAAAGLAALADGVGVLITNIGPNQLQLDNENAGSTAANQFFASGNIVLFPGQGVIAVYEAGSENLWFIR